MEGVEDWRERDGSKGKGMEKEGKRTGREHPSRTPPTFLTN